MRKPGPDSSSPQSPCGACSARRSPAAAKLGTRGIVVQRDAHAGAVVLATRNGNLKRIKIGQAGPASRWAPLVQVRGTKVSVVGHARKAKLRGVVVRRQPQLVRAGRQRLGARGREHRPRRLPASRSRPPCR